jgi:hypothetical protein
VAVVPLQREEIDMQIDGKALHRITAQLRLVSVDIGHCRRCLRDLSRLRTVQQLQAVSSVYDVSGFVEDVAPTLLRELAAAAQRLSQNIPQIVRAIDALTASDHAAAPTPVREEGG